MIFLRCFVLVFVFGLSVHAYMHHKCETNEKFIKAYRYISRLKNVSLTKHEITNYASQVASKCHDTFDRFDEIFEVTEKTDLSVKASIILAIRIALNKDIHLGNFQSIYKFLIDPKGPDLPYKKALEYSESFSKRGKYAYDLLEEIFNFCMKKKDIAYTRPQCVELAEKVAGLGIRKDTIFSDAFQYFSKHKYLNYSYRKSIDLTLKILKYGDDSFDDFRKVFEFALKKNGVNLSRDESLKLALKVLKKAELTEKARKEKEKEEKERK